MVSFPPARFLAPLTLAEQAQVMSFTQAWAADTDTILFRQGEPVPCLWMIDSGFVRFEIVASEGRRTVSAFGIPGRCFGEVELLGHFVGQATAVTSTPCTGWTFSMAAMNAAIDSVPAFARLMLSTLARNTRLVLMLYQHVLTLAPRERLALTLLNLARDDTDADGRRTLVVPFTQDTLSEMVGSSRQFVSKHMSQWTELGWIAPRYGRLEITDPDALKATIDALVDPVMFALAEHV
jgi:CRP-like cAMP-binding protein